MARSLTQFAALEVALAISRAHRRGAFALLAATAFLCAIPTARADAQCSGWQAELTAVENSVDVKRANEAAWHSARTGTVLCYGDAISVKASSRAVLTLPDHTTLRLDANTTVTLAAPDKVGGSLIELLRGVIHVISRDPRSLKFTTPFANAGLKGTEFDLRVSDEEQKTEVLVLEGEVAMSTPMGDVDVPSGELAVARSGEPPTAQIVREPIELMRWTGHYPRIVARTLPGADEQSPPGANAEFFALRAAARLETGGIETATADLETALQMAPTQSTALALQAIVADRRADHDTSLALASAATKGIDATAAAWLALSYAQEGVADLAGSTESAMRAVALEPDNPLALSRLAALELSNGGTTSSVEHAKRAADIAPQRAEPQTVLGFAYLARLDSAAARERFDAAVELEPSAPLPWLGRGLALIQAGDLTAGRQQIEEAVIRDPTNALTRSYVAKIYEAEHRAKLPGSQLDLAKRFDPLDPTPWLYAALQKLRANRPVEALRDLQAATTKNDDRLVLRSRLPLDQDLATRSSGVARIDAELGFERLALKDAWEGVVDHPGDYSVHRMLADAYAQQPRQETARVSELVIASLLQPANLTPVPAQLGQPSTFFSTHLGPGLGAFTEFGSPVTQNGLRLQTSGTAGGNGTSGAEVSVAGLHDQLSYGFSGYHFRSDGFRVNNDRDERVANAYVQFRPAAATTLQFELRSARNTRGDLTLAFDPESFSPISRADDSSDSLRFGARHDFTAHDTLLASAIHTRGETDSTIGDMFSSGLEQSATAIDLQFMHDAGKIRLLAGVSHAARDGDGEFRFPDPDGATSSVPYTDRLTKTDLYVYALANPAKSLTITAAATWNRVSNEPSSEHGIDPKLGINWHATSRTTIRAAAFRSPSSSLANTVLNAQPRLEPAQIAGFSQIAFDTLDGRSTVRGVALDHTLSSRVFAGWEATHRDTVIGVVNPLAPPGEQLLDITFRERTHQGYLYWTPQDRLSFSAKLEHSRYGSSPTLNGIPLFNYSDLTIERVPIELRYFSPTGWGLGFRTSHVEEHGTFVMSTADTLAPGKDRFWLIDAFVSYRLPHRRGLLSLNADNLLDRRFRFQDAIAEDATLIPQRLLSFRFTLSFD